MNSRCGVAVRGRADWAERVSEGPVERWTGEVGGLLGVESNYYWNIEQNYNWVINKFVSLSTKL